MRGGLHPHLLLRKGWPLFVVLGVVLAAMTSPAEARPRRSRRATREEPPHALRAHPLAGTWRTPAVRAVALEGDRNVDVLVAPSKGGVVALAYPGLHATTLADGPATVAFSLGDVDGDGAPDLVQHTKDLVLWRKNPRTRDAGPWTAAPVAALRARDVALGDLDGNRTTEIAVRHAVARGDEIALLRQDAAGTWQRATIAVPSGRGLALADLDGDGDRDVVVPGGWHEHDGDAHNGRWPLHPVLRDVPTESRIVVVDVDHDGRPDVVAAVAGKKGRGLAWIKAPQDPKLDDWSPRGISDRLGGVRALTCADLDDDGDVDVVAGSPSGLDLLLNDGGAASWTPVTLSKSSVNDLAVSDIDRDGDLDVVVAEGRRLVFWENTAPAKKKPARRR